MRRTALIELGRNSPGDEDVTAALLKPSGPGNVRPKVQFAVDSPLEGAGFEPVWGFCCQVVVLVCCRFFVRSGKAVLRPVACDQVRGARGKGSRDRNGSKAWRLAA